MNMKEFYSLFPWPEDLNERGRGRERYNRAISYFRKVIEHPFFSKSSFNVLDLMGGVGIGGVALCKVLKEDDKEVELTILDLRGDALMKARDFALEELGKVPKTIEGDAFLVHELVSGADVVLVYGLTMPHFDPWRASLLLNSVREILKPDGAVLIHHMDQVYWENYLHPSNEVYPFFNGDSALSLYRDYDVSRGLMRRMIVSPKTGKWVKYGVFQWNFSLMAALVWIFFEDVEYFPILSDWSAGIIMGIKPRMAWRVEDLNEPAMLGGTGNFP